MMTPREVERLLNECLEELDRLSGLLPPQKKEEQLEFPFVKDLQPKPLK